MFVYGGINEKNLLLDDSLVFNLETAKWSEVFPVGEHIGGLAYHTMT
jgi:hypothetical protein